MAQGTHHQSCYSWIFLAFEWNQDEWTRMNRVSVMGIPYTLLVSAPGCGVMSLQWTTLWQAQLCQRAVPCTITFCNSVGSQWGIWETIPFMVSSSLIFTSPTRVLALAQLTARSASCNRPSVAATPKKNVTCSTTAKTVEQQSLTHLSTNGERSLNSTVPW